MIYKILEVVDDQTSNGKPMKRLAIEGLAKKMNIFSDFPHYAEIVAGSTIDAEIRKNEKGYDNLYSNEIKPRSGAPSAFKQAQIEKTMERKEASIGKFQDNREHSVKVAATMRDAVLIATSLTQDQWQSTTMQEEVRFWREWLWNEYDNVGSDTMPPF
jgi:hypothetical protein